jgi:F420-0:gamma-glutamyl ligase
MSILPDYIGVSAFGIKMGIIVPGSDLVEMAYEALSRCNSSKLLHDNDTVCVTESVVARAQNNYVTIKDIALEVRKKLNLKPGSKIGVLFPMLSRNRFAPILKGLAAAVPQGEVVVQLSYPADEVGNQILPDDFAEKLGKDLITLEDIGPERFKHPITQVDYIDLYNDIITQQGCRSHIFLANDPLEMVKHSLDGIIVANVHTRDRVKSKVLSQGFKNCITLQEICCDNAEAWSEWGVLGSNLSSGDKLKLAPREADQFADRLQTMVREGLGKSIEVIVYGDGAYCDPATRIYELADPQPVFGMTKGLRGKYREGIKYKYMVDKMLDEGNDIQEIESFLESRKGASFERDSIETEGTTPRKAVDLIASLADLVSGSADAGTPLILVKGFFS